jgi:hypothetical protein
LRCVVSRHANFGRSSGYSLPSSVSCPVGSSPARRVTLLCADDETPSQKVVIRHEPGLALKAAHVADPGSNPFPLAPRHALQPSIGHQIGPHSEALTGTAFNEKPVATRRLVNHPRGVLTEGTGNDGRRRSIAHRTTVRGVPRPSKAPKSPSQRRATAVCSQLAIREP